MSQPTPILRLNDTKAVAAKLWQDWQSFSGTKDLAGWKAETAKLVDTVDGEVFELEWDANSVPNALSGAENAANYKINIQSGAKDQASYYGLKVKIDELEHARTEEHNKRLAAEKDAKEKGKDLFKKQKEINKKQKYIERLKGGGASTASGQSAAQIVKSKGLTLTEIPKLAAVLDPIIDAGFTNKSDNEEEKEKFKEITDAMPFLSQKVVDSFVAEAKALKDATTTPAGKWEAWLEKWGKWLVGEGKQADFAAATGETESDLKVLLKDIPSANASLLADEWSDKAYKDAEASLDSKAPKRSLSDYFSTTWAVWKDWVTDGWSDGWGGKLLSALKLPVAVIGSILSVAADVVVRPITGKSINRRFAENRGLVITSSGNSSSSTST